MKIYMCVAKSDAKKGPVLLKALILYGASPISRASRIGPVVGAAIGRRLLSYPMPQLPYELCLGSLVVAACSRPRIQETSVTLKGGLNYVDCCDLTSSPSAFTFRKALGV